MKWIWPLCWYYRIEHLERENAILLISIDTYRKEAQRWEDVARGAAVAQCGMTAAYVSAITSVYGSLSSQLPQGDKS